MQKIKNNSLIDTEKAIFLTGLAESIADVYFKLDEMIQPTIIAEFYGITYSFGEYEDFYDGLLEHYDGRFHIYINKQRQQTTERQRFTFGHELGHFFIDGHRNALANGETPYHSSFTDFSSENIVEKEADFFSASLLMPKNRVLKIWRQFRRFNFDMINQCSEKFGVSIVATIFRVFYLDLHPMMIVKAKNGRIESIFRSHDFYYFPKHKTEKIPEDSIMYEYFNSNKKYNVSKQIWTGDWFEASKEKKIYERCLYYDKEKICYSLVWED